MADFTLARSSYDFIRRLRDDLTCANALILARDYFTAPPKGGTISQTEGDLNASQVSGRYLLQDDMGAVIGNVTVRFTRIPMETSGGGPNCSTAETLLASIIAPLENYIQTNAWYGTQNPTFVQDAGFSSFSFRMTQVVGEDTFRITFTPTRMTVNALDVSTGIDEIETWADSKPLLN